MSHDPDVPPPPKSAQSRAAVVFALVLGLFLGVIFVGSMGALLLSRHSGRALLSHMWSAMTGRTLSIDVSQPTVVDRIQRLQRLETVVYTMDKIVSGAKQISFFPDLLAGDRLLMLVHGEVVAGIDFSNLKPGDVRVEGKQVPIASSRAAGVQHSHRQREDPRVFQANRPAGTHRPESGNGSAPGSGTSAATSRHGRWHPTNSPAECNCHDHRPFAGIRIREDWVRLTAIL
jgi:uncharacterized protein DUF4230